jgi:hypothetical protein
MECPLRMFKARLRKIKETTDFFKRRSGIPLDMPEELVKSEQTFFVYVMN